MIRNMVHNFLKVFILLLDSVFFVLPFFCFAGCNKNYIAPVRKKYLIIIALKKKNMFRVNLRQKI